MNIYVFGDSILKGVRLENGTYSRDRSWEERLAEQFGLNILNRSRFGCTVEKALPMIRRECASPAEGALAAVEYGGNDCDYDWTAISENPEGQYECRTPPEQFERDFREILHLVKESGRIPVVFTLPPIHSERYLRFVCRNGNSPERILHWLGDVEAISRWQERYSAMAAAAARETGARLLDLRAAFPRNPDRLRDYLCEDGIHPSRLGQELIYHAVADDLCALLTGTAG